MTNQLDKWNRREGKRAAEGHVLKQAEMKREAVKTDTDKGIEAAAKAGFKRTTEDVAMVLFRDSIEPFVNIWTNSAHTKMNDVMKETVMPMMKTEIRSMVKEVVSEVVGDVVREVIQDEIQQALRGAMAGISQAIAPMFRNPQIVPGLDTDGDIEVAVEEPEFKNGLQQLAEERAEEKEREFKTPRYSVPRITTCSICGEQGHNKRSCKKGAVEVGTAN